MNKDKLMLSLMFLPIVITILSLFLLPDQIAVRFGKENVQFGSKFSLLIFPVLCLWIGGIMMIVIKNIADGKQADVVRKIYYLCMGIFYFAMSIFLLSAFLIHEDGRGVKLVEIVTASFTLLSAVILAIYVSYTARKKDQFYPIRIFG